MSHSFLFFSFCSVYPNIRGIRFLTSRKAVQGTFLKICTVSLMWPSVSLLSPAPRINISFCIHCLCNVKRWTSKDDPFFSRTAQNCADKEIHMNGVRNSKPGRVSFLWNPVEFNCRYCYSLYPLAEMKAGRQEVEKLRLWSNQVEVKGLGSHRVRERATPGFAHTEVH